MNILSLIGREKELFLADIDRYDQALSEMVSASRFLVIGGAGSIGTAVVKEIFRRNPRKIHVVDLSENNLVELVRDLRSSSGYIDGEFNTFSLDVGSVEYQAFIKSDGQYDYVLNLAALKHVRSEKDPYTLMRMIDVNILHTERTLQQSIDSEVKKYFCVSTDKAANPVNMMGASKRIMEMFLMRYSEEIDISTARFANVAFSDGSLLDGFENRLLKQQPIVAPNDIRRYFITPKESGELCLISCLLGENRNIFFPKSNESLRLMTFAEIAEKYLEARGFEPFVCGTEEEARALVKTLPTAGKWPCLFTATDTTGEKDFEEFFTEQEILDLTRFQSIGIIKSDPRYDEKKLLLFRSRIAQLKESGQWKRADLTSLFIEMIPEFKHKDTGKYLDSKM